MFFVLDHSQRNPKFTHFHVNSINVTDDECLYEILAWFVVLLTFDYEYD